VNGSKSELHRFNGNDWTVALTDLATVNCIGEEGQNLLVGTDTGVIRVALYPPEGQPFAGTVVGGIEAAPVRTLFRDSAGTLWMGSDKGAFTLTVDPPTRRPT